MNFISKKIKDPKIWLYLILPYLILVIFHLCLNWKVNIPHIFPDEITQLGHARYLSGGNHMALFDAPLAHFGYSLFLVPLFWLFSNPSAIFKGIVILNAFLMSSLYFSLYYILRNIFFTKKNVSFFIAWIISLYPAFFIYTKISWAENVLIPLYATVIVLLYLFLKRKSYLLASLFGISIGFLYIVHIRTLPIIIVAILFLIFLSIIKILPRLKVLLSLFFITIFYFVTKIVMSHLINVGYESVHEFSKIGILSNIFDFNNLILGIVGQLWYLSMATYGLFIVGLFYLIFYLYTKIRYNFKEVFRNNRFTILLFIFLTSLASFMTSVLFMMDGNRVDQTIYGRYNEIFIAIFILIALLSFYHKKNNIKNYIFSLFSLLILNIVLFNWNTALTDPSKPTFTISIPSMAIWLDLLGSIKIWPILLGILFIFSILFFKLNKLFFQGLGVLGIIFIFLNVYGYFWFEEHYIFNNTDLMPKINELNIKNLDYNIHYYNCSDSKSLFGDLLLQANYYNFRYLLPNTNIHYFNSEKGGLPQHSFVITNTCWTDADKLNAQLIEVDSYGEQALWQVP